MALKELNKGEQQVIFECLRAAAEGPFFPNSEFHTLFGLEREEVKQIADEWPNIEEAAESVVVAINNSINNLLGYPHRREDVWSNYISVQPEELYLIFAKWRGEPVSSYFDGLM